MFKRLSFVVCDECEENYIGGQNQPSALGRLDSMKFEDRTDTAKLRKQATAIYIAVEKPVADDIAASLLAAASEIEFLRRGLDEGAALVRRAQAERMPLVEQLQTDHVQITTLVKLLRGALGRCRSDDPLRPEIEAALKQELWVAPASTGNTGAEK